MPSNYDNAAWFYDSLSRLVYGKAIIKAQVYLLQYIPPNSSLLIVGGGTGWILDRLTRLYSSGLKITYVEVSAKMMALSQKRNTGNNKVVFINDAIENLSGLPQFDVIITPFLFDNFNEVTFSVVFDHLNNLLIPGGLWLYTDFQLTGKWWQSVLLKSMLLFFKLLCNIESIKLHHIEPHFMQAGYQATGSKTFFKTFIISKAYTKIKKHS
ncbi:MAG TPA: class I SAM-dependent methyltransferase [Mucilaginibacter sp.]